MMRKWMVAAMGGAILVLLVPGLVAAVNGSYIYGEVQYSGSHTGTVVVCALEEGQPSPTTECVNLAVPGAFTLGPLAANWYDVCAFIDFDDDGPPRQADEPFGCTMVDLSGGGSVRGVVVVMEDPEPEFVPEPGTLALLGSGLAGLAGYAGLRWRSRKQ